MALKVTDTIVCFVALGDIPFNGGRRIAPCIQQGFIRDNTNNDERIDLTAHCVGDNQNVFMNAVPRAIDIADAVTNGYRWMTIAEAEAAGVQLHNPNQNLLDLL